MTRRAKSGSDYAEMLRSKYVWSPSCWIWTAGQKSGGYGSVKNYRECLAGNTNVTMLAHRAVWEQRFGPVPDGHELHHECGERLCVNPAHLTLVTPAEHKEIHRWRNIVRDRELRREKRDARKRAREVAA